MVRIHLSISGLGVMIHLAVLHFSMVHRAMIHVVVVHFELEVPCV